MLHHSSPHLASPKGEGQIVLSADNQSDNGKPSAPGKTKRTKPAPEVVIRQTPKPAWLFSVQPQSGCGFRLLLLFIYRCFVVSQSVACILCSAALHFCFAALRFRSAVLCMIFLSVEGRSAVSNLSENV